MTGASLAGTWGTRERRRHLSGVDRTRADQIPAAGLGLSACERAGAVDEQGHQPVQFGRRILREAAVYG